MEKWLIMFFCFLAFAIGMYFLNNYFYIQEEVRQSEQNDYIINQIDNLSAEREEENIKQTKIILANISHLVTDNGDLLKAIIENQNITVTFNNSSHPNGTGTISALGKPEIVR